MKTTRIIPIITLIALTGLLTGCQFGVYQISELSTEGLKTLNDLQNEPDYVLIENFIDLKKKGNPKLTILHIEGSSAYLDADIVEFREEGVRLDIMSSEDYWREIQITSRNIGLESRKPIRIRLGEPEAILILLKPETLIELKPGMLQIPFTEVSSVIKYGYDKKRSVKERSGRAVFVIGFVMILLINIFYVAF